MRRRKRRETILETITRQYKSTDDEESDDNDGNEVETTRANGETRGGLQRADSYSGSLETGFTGGEGLWKPVITL